MKLVVAALLVVACTAHTLEDSQYEFLFTKWVSQHGKRYESNEFFERFRVFQNNLDFIMKSNKANNSYTLAMNHFGDLTWDEFRTQHMGYKHINRDYIRSLNAPEETVTEGADALDWRSQGAVTAVKDQGQCGSCWAFSATGGLEGAYKLAGNKLLSFSEQQLVDCATAQGNMGCNGGLMDYAFEYWHSTAACLESDYTYTARDGSCKKTCQGVTTVSGYKDVAQSETSLMSAIQTGPVSIAIEADQSAFQFYSGGVMDGRCGSNLDHGVLLVGYGTDSGKDYWIVKNSWGARWGESGYIRLIRNKNQCGLANAASYPTL